MRLAMLMLCLVVTGLAWADEREIRLLELEIANFNLQVQNVQLQCQQAGQALEAHRAEMEMKQKRLEELRRSDAKQKDK